MEVRTLPPVLMAEPQVIMKRILLIAEIRKKDSNQCENNDWLPPDEYVAADIAARVVDKHFDDSYIIKAVRPYTNDPGH